jgi:WD40 repeat protein
VTPRTTVTATGLETAIVRVVADNGSAAGVGFLATGRTVLTCAHVLSGTGSARVEFPLLPGSGCRTAKVTTLLPVLADGTGDIAVLTLETDPPPSAQPVRLVAADDLWGHPCRLFGFSGGREDGVWAAGVLRGRQAAGWVQLESCSTTGYAVELGFSGGPVWDDQLGAVVGMAVAAEVDGDLRVAYMIPAALLSRCCPDLGEAAGPYRGLAAFREQDAGVFFGRADRTAQLASEIDRRSFVAVVGPSGTGKSSLVFGGLLPAVRRRPQWAVATMRAARASSGVTALAAALLPLLEPEQTETERLAALSRLTAVLRDGHLRDAVGRIVTRAGATRLLLIVDQFEEVITAADAAEVTSMLLNGLGSGGVTVVATLRADFLGRALRLPALAEAFIGAVFAIGEMDRDRLRQVIEGPLPKDTGYEPGLVDRILDDVGDDPGRLPLLEFTLTLLWEQRANGRLTHSAYQELGGVKGALARYAERVYRDDIDAADQDQVQRLLTQLVRPGAGGEPMRRVARRAELGERRWLLGQYLAETRLVTAGRDAVGSETLELVHEALIDGWARLRQWADQDRVFRAWQERVREDSAEWEKLEGDPGALLRGMPLAEAMRWLDDREDDIGDAERRYIKASKAYEGRSVRRLREIVAALAVLVLIAAGLGVYAVRKGGEATEQGEKAQARYLVSRAQELNSSRDSRELDLGLLLSAAAYRFARDDQTRANVTAVAGRYRYVSDVLPAADDGLGGLSFSPTDPNLLAARGDGRIALWDVAQRRELRATPIARDSSGGPMAFTPDGGFLAMTENIPQQGYRVKLWRVAGGEPEQLWADPEPDAGLDGLSFDATGTRLAGCTTQAFTVWQLHPTTPLISIRRADPHQSCLMALTGDRLTVAEGRRLVTWSVSTKRLLSRVTVPPSLFGSAFDSSGEDAITGLRTAPGGRVALLQNDRRGYVWWDLDSGTRLPGYGSGEQEGTGTMPGLSADGRLAFFPDGSVVRMSDRMPLNRIPVDLKGGGVVVNRDGSLAAIDTDAGVVKLIRIGDFQTVAAPHDSSFAFWADGRHITWYHSDQSATARTIDPPGDYSHTEPMKPADPEYPVGYESYGGGMIALVDTAGRLRLADLTTPPGNTRVIAGPWRKLRAVALDVTESFLAVSDASSIHVRNLRTGSPVVTIPLTGGFRPEVLALGRGGSYLWATDSGRSVLWDLSSGTPQTVPLPESTSPAMFSPDGRWLALPTADDVAVWDLAHRSVSRRLPGDGVVAFDWQGNRIALNAPGTEDNINVVDVRDISNGQLVSRIDSGDAQNGRFSADGTRFVTLDGGVLTDYPLSAEAALRQICRIVGRELTRDEWRTYAAGYPYRKVCTSSGNS